jgi:hypothetical protein
MFFLLEFLNKYSAAIPTFPADEHVHVNTTSYFPLS